MRASITLAALAASFFGGSVANYGDYNDNIYKYVAVFSVDGFHASDVEKYLAVRPHSNISALLQTGYEYTDALTSAPSDSFPGSLAQFTGAGPRTTGVWYDDTYDRKLFAPGSNCTEAPGAEGRSSHPLRSLQV